jgi:XisH protein
MPTPDAIHEVVKSALVKGGWTITADPYVIEYGGVRVYADLAAESRPIEAEREGRRIIVEIKSFLGLSPVHDFEVALGQYSLYRTLLGATAPDHEIYLAVGSEIFRSFFSRQGVAFVVRQSGMKLLVVNLESKEIERWTD